MLNFLLNPEIGACAFGVASLEVTPPDIMESYSRWLKAGNMAGMDYLANHLPLRQNPELLLPGAKSIISIAFPYSPTEWRPQSLPVIASYAYGADYHDVLRTRLRKAVERLESVFGGEYRICIDSAPIFERLWAEKCGIGSRSDNGLIAIPGYGTRVFLSEILSTAELPEERGVKREIVKRTGGERREREKYTSWDGCLHCGKCRKACPAGALQPDSTVDARRCLSYLTIEHRGEWTVEGERAMQTPAGRHTLFGCDICQQVCPMNAPHNTTIPPTHIEEFLPRHEIMTLTAEQAKAMTQEEFSRIFKGSAIKRTKLAGFLRNANNLK